MKPCPYCGEQIQDSAIKCRFCGEWLEKRPSEPQPRPQPERRPEASGDTASFDARRGQPPESEPEASKSDKAGGGCLVVILIALFFASAIIYGITRSGDKEEDKGLDKGRNLAVKVMGDSLYETTYELAYRSGYEGGKQEREEGYPYEPGVFIKLPIIQMAKEYGKSKFDFTPMQEKVFERAFRDGFLTGFKDGYYGHPKKKTRF